MRISRVIFTTVAVLAAGAGTGVGCLEGGLNQNQHAPGNQDNGVAIGVGDIAIDPTGRFLVYQVDTQLQVADVSTGERHRVAGLTSVQRLSFGPPGSHVVYIVAGTLDRVGSLSAYDLVSRRTLWSHEAELSIGGALPKYSLTPWVVPAADGRSVVVAATGAVQVLDPATGTVRHSVPAPKYPVDLDVLPDSSRAVLTPAHVWPTGGDPSTRLSVLELDTGRVTTIDVPNCASELTVTPDGKHAFLAPTSCRRDPVSVIDLEHGRWLRNLPGFGPVAVAPDGQLAVAFLDATQVDAALFDDPAQIPPASGTRYHLMLVDTATLAFTTVPVGDTLPRYAITPDGRILLVDGSAGQAGGRLRVLDVARRRLASIDSTTDLRLEDFVMTSDATRVFLLFDGLYRIDLTPAQAHVAPIGLPFVPRNLNITPDDSHLILRESEDRVWIYDIAAGKLQGEIDTTALALLRRPGLPGTK